MKGKNEKTFKVIRGFRAETRENKSYALIYRLSAFICGNGGILMYVGCHKTLFQGGDQFWRGDSAYSCSFSSSGKGGIHVD